MQIGGWLDPGKKGKGKRRRRRRRSLSTFPPLRGPLLFLPHIEKSRPN